MRPKTEGILESSLYVADVARSAQFYEKIFGFQVISDFGGRAWTDADAAWTRSWMLFCTTARPGPNTPELATVMGRSLIHTRSGGSGRFSRSESNGGNLCVVMTGFSGLCSRD